MSLAIKCSYVLCVCVSPFQKAAMSKRQRIEDDEEEELTWQLDAARSVPNADLHAAAEVISSNDASRSTRLVAAVEYARESIPPLSGSTYLL